MSEIIAGYIVAVGTLLAYAASLSVRRRRLRVRVGPLPEASP